MDKLARHSFARRHGQALRLPGIEEPQVLNALQLHLILDPQAQYVHPILAVESFVDGQWFRGTLYKASNWTDRKYWGVESGLHQRLDCSGFEDRVRIRHKGALHIVGRFARVGVALFVQCAPGRAVVRERTYPWWREWNAGHRWHIIRQMTEPVD